MNHDVCLEVINADVEGDKRDHKEGERGDVNTDEVIRKLALENNNEIGLAFNSRDNRWLNIKLCEIKLIFKTYLLGFQFNFIFKSVGNT